MINSSNSWLTLQSRVGMGCLFHTQLPGLSQILTSFTPWTGLSYKLSFFVYNTFFTFRAAASELFSDNITAITCILHQGNLRSDPLMLLPTHILEFYWHHSICLVPKLVSGSLNVLPDQSSNPNPISTEWTLNRRTFEWVCSHVSAFRRVLSSKNCWNDLKRPSCDN